MCERAVRPSVVVEIYCSTKDIVLNATVHPTQRRLMVALIVTLACLPLLVLDMLQGSTVSGASETASTSSESSLVVAVAPTVDAISTSTTVVEAVVPETVVAPTPSTTVVPLAPRAVPTTTTTAPRPVVTAPTVVQSDAEFMACVRYRESRNDYTASDSSGTFLGAYQIYQGGWDSVAARAGRHDLVGIPPNQASPSDQDAIAFAMLQYHGRAPWGGSCR